MARAHTFFKCEEVGVPAYNMKYLYQLIILIIPKMDYDLKILFILKGHK